jgi:DNA-binding NarL/FixJ family response regulator
MSEPLRVVLADDHFVVRAGVEALLSEVSGLEIAGLAASGPELISMVDQVRPDAVLTDIRMPPGNRTEGIDAALEIRRRWPRTGVVVLSQHLAEDYVRALFLHGSAGLGYLLKERVGRRDEPIDALRRTSQGEAVLDRRVVDLLVGPSVNSVVDELTTRETEVLELMAQGLSNPLIAQQLSLSLSSVEKHISSIFQKFGLAEDGQLHRRVAAVVAYRNAVAG